MINAHPALPVFVALVTALVLAAPVIAQDRPKVDVDGYFTMLEELRTDLEEGTPRELNRDEWREFERIVGRFESLLGNVESVDELDRREKIRVFNLQEELDTVLIGHPDLQVVCNERQGTGSRIPRRDCRTVEQIRSDQRRAQQWVRSVPFLQNQPAGTN